MLKKSLQCLTLFLLCIGISYAAGPSPAGMWQTVVDGKPYSIVKITVSNGVLQGRVVKQFVDCTDCTAEWRNTPKKGMAIVYGLREKNGVWEGGYILDPNTGKPYRCEITISADGRTLHVRGFVGISLLGKTVDWKRV